MKDLRVSIVIPCLNEEESLGITCASLGFGEGKNCPENSALILVDNGSTDQSVALAQSIAAASPPGSVHLAYESERGFVPPRRHGNAVAGKLGSRLGFSPKRTLILQCDADTIYHGAYVDEMRDAAEQEGRGFLLQAQTRYPEDFRDLHPTYTAFCDRVDLKLGDLLLDHPDQILVDDKAVGYLLEDYLRWGGHQREFLSSGEEVDSETARLFMRAKAYGSRLAAVESAIAEHSVRKILRQPALDLATAGFPRERSWQQSWTKRTDPMGMMDRFLAFAAPELIDEALDLRRKHILALFGLLPLHVARTLKRKSCIDDSPAVPKVTLPDRNLENLRATPAIFIEDVLRACSLIAE